MRSFIPALPLLVLCCLLAACGGSDDDKEPVEPEPIIEEQPEPITTSTIQGSIKVASNIIKDSDLNDRNTPLVDNSSLSKAQEVSNIVTIQGFATATPTSEFGSSSEDRFFNTTDADDYFLVNLQANQLVQLQVVNYDPDTSDTFYSGDLDLYLVNYQSGDSYASYGSGEFETLIVPEAGLYYINVHAFYDASRYVLSIRQPNSANMSELSALSTQISDSEFVANEVIIQFNDNLQTASTDKALSNLHPRHAGKSRPTLATLSDTVSSQASVQGTGSSMLSLANRYPKAYEKLMTIRKMKTLARSKSVKSVSLNFLRKAMRVPADPHYQYQWHYPAMNLPQAWEITTGTPSSGSVVVAVIDTGIISSHPDLSNQLVPGYDFIRDDENSRDAESGIDSNPEDPGDSTDLGNSSWHGTHVAGTIAAQSNNNVGVAGVSWGAKIMPLRVLGQFGGNTYDIMQAMLYAAGLDNDSGTKPAKAADIINLSLGGGGFSQIEADLYKAIHDQGIIIVAAAGNENSGIAAYPASYNGVISVSATNFNKQRAPYSNFGANIDIAAPGGDLTRDANRDGLPDGVASTLADDSSGTPKPIYAFLQGTSMASPHVAGMFALMKAVHPELAASRAIELLETGHLTDPAGITGRDDIYGFGTANALKAVQAALAEANSEDTPEPPVILQASPASLNFSSDTLSSSLRISNEGSGSVSLLSVVNNIPWLSVTEQSSSNPDILAQFSILADPENLSTGFYFGALEFYFDNAPPLKVNVNLTVGLEDTGGSLSRIYVNLYDIDQELVVDWQQARENRFSELVFNFNNVPQGQYIIVAGTDIDNDNFICQLAEGCAVYPPSSQISPINTQEPGTVEIEMTANVLSSQEITSNAHFSQFAGKGATALPAEDSAFKRKKVIQIQ